MPEIAVGDVWKCGEDEWIAVFDVRGDVVTGRLRTIPRAERDWTGSPADFDNFQRTEKRGVTATCKRWNDGHCIRVLSDHWIEYDGAAALVEIQHPPSASIVVVSMILRAVSDDEAISRVEAALAEAGADCTGRQMRRV